MKINPAPPKRIKKREIKSRKRELKDRSGKDSLYHKILVGSLKRCRGGAHATTRRNKKPIPKNIKKNNGNKSEVKKGERTRKRKTTRPSEANDASCCNFFIFSFFLSLFLPVPPSSPSLLPPRPSFLLVPPSSSSLLSPFPSFFLVQQCLNHLESVKVYSSSILTKALPTDRPTAGRTDRRTRPLIEMRTHLKTSCILP